VTELRFLAEYGFADDFALQANVPFRIMDTRTRFTDLAGGPLELDYESIHHRDETLFGLGDIQLLVHTGRSLGEFLVGARAGLSIPTGTVHENPYRLGDEGRPHQHIQFGTGTFDPVLGLDIAHPLGAWTFSAFGQAQTPLYEGRHGYRAGARSLGGLAASRRLDFGSLRLTITAAHEWAERWDGSVPTEDGNRGRTDFLVGPGITVPFGGDYSASLDVGIRAYGRAVGAQLDMPVVVNVSIGRLFHLETGRHIEPVEPETVRGDIRDVVMQGEAAPLVPLAGKWTVFDFWATWCEACVDLDDRLQALARADADVAVRRVNIVDLDSPISQRELKGVTSLPHIRLVAPDGTTAWEASGAPRALVEGITSRMRTTERPHGSAATAGRAAPQVVRIEVTADGFQPSRVEVKRGRPVRLLITRKTDQTCATDIVLPTHGLTANLPLGKTVEVRFTPTRPGELTYACSMNMIKGVIIVR
jgi:thiol-disulfide isomerase/thioredoxin